MNPCSKPCRAAILLLVAATVLVTGSSAGAANTVLKFDTILGDFNVRLLDTDTPLTTANFMLYVNGGSYNDSVFHRLVRGFVLQGGGYGANAIPNHGTVDNEFGRSNIRGTVAMAKVGGDPDSATSEFFFNLSDTNASNLDNQNGGFTVFAYVLDGGMLVVDALADGVQYSNFLIDTGDANDPLDSRYDGEWPRIVPLEDGSPILEGGQEVWYYEWINSVSVVGVDGDVDLDGDVDDDDYNAFVASFGRKGLGLHADFDGDYDVDLDDFMVLKSNYPSAVASPLPTPGAAVPEPTSICLLSLCGIAMIRRRRGKV
ncbi:MAG: peptidylprolyl isomerase [Phycisphaerae bacterium]|jgi:cyclophilin family peptidyl-prolyl cis-trans isomerase|nr:peptidylprolyl isomerase [Phycisphaerae bacterium]